MLRLRNVVLFLSAAVLTAAPPEADGAITIPNAKTVLTDRIELLLPGPFEHLATGAGGRLLFCQLKDSAKLVVVDLEISKVIREINLPAADALVAAGRDKFVIVQPGQKLLHRWNIATFERERTVPIPGVEMPKLIRLGSNSNGPLLLWSGTSEAIGEPVELWDLEELRPLKVNGNLLTGVRYQTTVSADGTTFVGWQTGSTGQHYTVMRVSGN